MENNIKVSPSHELLEELIITSRDIANYVIDTLRKLYENATITATSVENKVKPFSH